MEKMQEEEEVYHAKSVKMLQNRIQLTHWVYILWKIEWLRNENGRRARTNLLFVSLHLKSWACENAEQEHFQPIHDTIVVRVRELCQIALPFSI